LHSNTFEGIAFSLNSILGIEVFVEAVGLGKGKDDLTEFVTEQSKPNQALTLLEIAYMQRFVITRFRRYNKVILRRIAFSRKLCVASFAWKRMTLKAAKGCQES
jgi:hypothetical protein